jgi:hypothetical protein
MELDIIFIHVYVLYQVFLTDLDYILYSGYAVTNKGNFDPRCSNVIQNVRDFEVAYNLPIFSELVDLSDHPHAIYIRDYIEISLHSFYLKHFSM